MEADAFYRVPFTRCIPLYWVYIVYSRALDNMEMANLAQMYKIYGTHHFYTILAVKHLLQLLVQ